MNLSKMKRRIQFLILLLIGVQSDMVGKTDSKEANKCYLFSSAPPSFCLYNVVRNDTITSLHFIFRGIPGDVFDIPDKFYLEDKQGRIYPMRSVQGVSLGEKNKCPLMGEVSFSLCFDPIDKKERFLDLHAADMNRQWFSFWGIHTPQMKPKKYLHVDHTKKAKVQNRAQGGNVTIKGTLKIKGENPQKIILHYLPDIGTRKQASSQVDEDGRFELKQRLDGEIISYLMFGMRAIPVYLYPTDTLYVEIASGYGKEVTVKYQSAEKHDTHVNLMTAMRPRWSYRENISRQRMSPMQLAEEMQESKNEDAKILKYFSWKYDLTAQESHLLDINLKTQRVSNALACMSFNVRQVYNQDSLLSQSEEQRHAFVFSDEARTCYQFVKEIDFCDSAYSILDPSGLLAELCNIPQVTLSRSIGGHQRMFEAIEYYMGKTLGAPWRTKLRFYM